MSGEHKIKEGDRIKYTFESTNASELLVFTDKMQVYKTRLYEFEDAKASVLGDYLPQKLGFEKEENVLFVTATKDYQGSLFAFFQNGKAARVDLHAYETKTNRKKLINAYSGASPLCAMFCIREECEFVCTASNGRCLIVPSAAIAPKTTKNTAGINVMTLKSKTLLERVEMYEDGMFEMCIRDRYYSGIYWRRRTCFRQQH